MGKLLLLMISFVLIYCGQANALVGVGAYVPFAGRMQTEADGKDNKTSFSPLLLFHHPFTFWGRHIFKPELGLVFHSDTTENYSKTTIFVLANFGFPFTNAIYLKYGLGTFVTQIQGDGKAVVLNNGSSTATFYQPGTKSSAYNSTVNLGLEFYAGKAYSFALDTYTFSILSSVARSVSYSLSLNYFY